MVTRVDIRCPKCSRIEEVVRSMIDIRPIRCPECREIMIAYFGNWDPKDLRYIGAFNPDKYDNETDRNIAKFQKQHL
jgi:uncharacterized Zn finger protein